MPIHLPFHLPRIPEFLKRPLDPSQTLEAFEHYAEKAINFATRHGGEIGRNIMDDLVDAAAPYAAFLDTTVDAFLPGINLYYGEKWASRQGRKDPFKQKGGVVRSKSSQLPAQPKRDMPFGNKRQREWDDRQASINKYLRRSHGMKRNNAVTGHYRKSKRRKRIQDPRGVVNVYDDHDELTADNSLYFYAQDFGSSNRALKIGSQAILKAALATIHIYPTNPAFVIWSGSPENDFTVYFRRTTGVNPTYEDSASTISMNNSTFEAASLDLYSAVKTQADAGYFPYGFKFAGGGRGNVMRSLGDSVITMSCSTIMQVQNTTKDDNLATTTADKVNANPLKGKIYRTRGFVPYVLPSVSHNNVEAVDFHDCTNSGVKSLGDRPDSSFMNHPPVGSSFFRYCKSSSNVTMQAGSIMRVKSYFKTRMTILNFFKKLSIIASDHPNTFGACTVVGLEQSMRSALDEGVRIGLNREISMKSHVRLKTKVPTIHTYTSTGSLV